MNWIDILIIVLVGLLGLLGWRRGVIQAVTALGGFIIGLTVAGRAYKPLASVLSDAIDSEGSAQMVAFAVIFLSIMVASMALGKVLRRTLQFFMLGWVDNAAGLALGALVGALVSSGPHHRHGRLSRGLVEHRRGGLGSGHRPGGHDARAPGAPARGIR